MKPCWYVYLATQITKEIVQITVNIIAVRIHVIHAVE